MSLTPGTRIGVFQLIDLIGRGGMGEVYRATDTSLGRQVAIKVLPEAFAQDAERLARFEREAKTIASLNHPNIAAIYAVDKSGGVTALVMELVEGDDLSQRIARGAIPIDDALPIAKQIAEALEAAHEQGIVHRDLKPANIKVRPDGTVKVLDFGLAKAMEAPSAMSPSVSQAPTITSPAMMTGVGMILGTAAYMSPEQARGKTVDKRADIWAFGAVVYEMLTGTRAFPGDDMSEVLAGVIKSEPTWDALPRLSPVLESFLRQCLKKDPKQRVQDIGDVRLALEGAFETGASQAANVSVAPHSAVWQRALSWASASLVTAVAIGLIAWSVWPSPAPLPVGRSQHVLPEGRVFTNTGRSILAMSPDGRRFVYKGTGGLYLRSMDALEDQLISGSSPVATNPTFSPDGTWLAFWTQENGGGGRLQKIAVVGGAPVPLTEVPANPVGIRWDEDDTILYGAGASFLRVSADGGKPEQLLEASGGWAQLLPDGATVLFQTQGGQVAVQSRESAAPTILFPGLRPTYLSTGHLVYVQDGVLFGVPFDAGTLQVTGGPVPLVDGIQGDPPQYAVSKSGSLVYVASGLAGGAAVQTLALVDRDGTVEPLNVPPNSYSHPRLSPDGTRLAVQVVGGARSDIWVYDLSGDTAFRRLTLEGDNTSPIWTTDGARITYASNRDGPVSIYWQAADGSGVAERLTTPEEGVSHSPEAWSPDGRTLALRVNGVGSQGSGLWTLSLDGGDGPQLFYDIPANQLGAVFSPDGNWLAYLSGDRLAAHIYVQPFPPTGEIRQVSSQGVDSAWPVWPRNGKELFYRATPSSGRHSIAAVGVTIGGGFKFGVERTLPIGGWSLVAGTRNFDVTADGQRFVMVFPAEQADAGESVRPTINIVENWFEELRQRVPTN